MLDEFGLNEVRLPAEEFGRFATAIERWADSNPTRFGETEIMSIPVYNDETEQWDACTFVYQSSYRYAITDIEYGTDEKEYYRNGDEVYAEYDRLPESDNTTERAGGVLSDGVNQERLGLAGGVDGVDRQLLSDDKNSSIVKGGESKDNELEIPESETPNTAVRFRTAAKDWLVSDRLAAEMESIKAQAEKDGTFMLAPNGNKSNLNKRNWLLVRTKEFKRWFGDWENDPANASKIVDENGEPLVVYHGSDKYGFFVFDKLKSDDKVSIFAAGTKRTANTYVKKQYEFTEEQKVYLSRLNRRFLEKAVEITKKLKIGRCEDARVVTNEKGLSYICFLLDFGSGETEASLYLEEAFRRESLYKGCIERYKTDFGFEERGILTKTQIGFIDILMRRIKNEVAREENKKTLDFAKRESIGNADEYEYDENSFAIRNKNDKLDVYRNSIRFLADMFIVDNKLKGIGADNVYKLFLNLRNVAEFDARSDNWNNIIVANNPIVQDGTYNTRTLTQAVIRANKNIEGIIIRNCKDDGWQGDVRALSDDIFISLRDKNAFKSAAENESISDDPDIRFRKGAPKAGAVSVLGKKMSHQEYAILSSDIKRQIEHSELGWQGNYNKHLIAHTANHSYLCKVEAEDVVRVVESVYLNSKNIKQANKNYGRIREWAELFQQIDGDSRKEFDEVVDNLETDQRRDGFGLHADGISSERYDGIGRLDFGRNEEERRLADFDGDSDDGLAGLSGTQAERGSAGRRASGVATRFRTAARNGELTPLWSQVFSSLLQETSDQHYYLHEITKQIEQALGRKLSLDENPYEAHSRVEAVAGARQKEFEHKHRKQLEKAYRTLYKDFAQRFGLSEEEAEKLAELYLYARDRKETNERLDQDFDNQTIDHKEYLKMITRDAEWQLEFARVASEINGIVSKTPEEVIDMVENGYDTKPFWSTWNAASRWIRDYSYRSGLISTEEYNRQNARQYYVPQSDIAQLNENLTAEQLEERQKSLSFTTTKSMGSNLANRHEKFRTTIATKPLLMLEFLASDMAQTSAINEANALLVKLAQISEASDVLRNANIEIRSQYIRKDERGIPTSNEIAEYKLFKSIFDDKTRTRQERDIALQALDAIDVKEDFGWDVARKNSLTTRIDGVPFKVNVIPPAEDRFSYADRMYYSLSHNAHKSDRLTKTFRSITRFFSQMFTTLNPAFAPVNIIRDYAWCISAGFVEEGGDFALQIVKNMSSMKSAANVIGGYIWKGEFDETTEYGRQFKDFILSGGSGGYALSRKNAIQTNKELVKRLSDEHNRGKFKKIYDAITTPAEYSELLTRFNVYRAAIACGRSHDQAMEISRNLNINFDKKGASRSATMKALTAFVPFTNATIGSLRGLYRMLNGDGKGAFQSAKGMKRLTAMFAAQYALGFVSEMLRDALCGGDDEDEEIAALWEDYYARQGTVSEISPEVQEELIAGCRWKHRLLSVNKYNDRKLSFFGMVIPVEPRLSVLTDLGRYTYLAIKGSMTTEQLVGRTLKNMLKNCTPLALMPENKDLTLENLLKVSPLFEIGFALSDGIGVTDKRWSGERNVEGLDDISVAMSKLFSTKDDPDDRLYGGESRFDVSPRVFQTLSRSFIPTFFRRLGYEAYLLASGNIDEWKANNLAVVGSLFDDQQKSYERNVRNVVKSCQHYIDIAQHDTGNIRNANDMVDVDQLDAEAQQIYDMLLDADVNVAQLKLATKRWNELSEAGVAKKLGYTAQQLDEIYDSNNDDYIRRYVAYTQDELQQLRDEIFYGYILPEYAKINEYANNNGKDYYRHKDALWE